jgi:hypothetical protein
VGAAISRSLDFATTSERQGHENGALGDSSERECLPGMLSGEYRSSLFVSVQYPMAQLSTKGLMMVSWFSITCPC